MSLFHPSCLPPVIDVFHLIDALNAHSRDPPVNITALKEEQLAFRQAEVEETIRILQSINHGEGDAVREQNRRGEGRDLNMWQGCLDTEQIIMAGHSYGATLAVSFVAEKDRPGLRFAKTQYQLQTLKNAPSHQLPIKGGIILDP